MLALKIIIVAFIIGGACWFLKFISSPIHETATPTEDDDGDLVYPASSPSTTPYRHER